MKYSEAEVNPNMVYGSEQRVMEIVGLGSGRGFELKGINLPEDWNKSIDILREIDRELFERSNTIICEQWGFSLEGIVFDLNNVLKGIGIRDNKTNTVSEIFLDTIFEWGENGSYTSVNLNTIESAIALQEIMINYLSFGWGENFPYSCVSRRGSRNLRIPKSVYTLDKEITNTSYQEKFYPRASNIAGRFGLDLEGEPEFDEKGILKSVAVFGDRTWYCREEDIYCAHNVDSVYQAAALHTIVARHINDLLEKFRVVE